MFPGKPLILVPGDFYDNEEAGKQVARTVQGRFNEVQRGGERPEGRVSGTNVAVGDQAWVSHVRVRTDGCAGVGGDGDLRDDGEKRCAGA